MLDTYSVPRNFNEYKLTKIWKSTLQLSSIGIYDDFFELGGHSLLIVKLIAAIKREFDCAISIIDIFKYPTISQLATCLDNPIDFNPPTILPIQTEGSKPPLFLIHPASGTPFPYLQMSGMLHDQPLYALVNPTLYNLDNKFNTVEEMAVYYLNEIQQFMPDCQYSLG